MNDRKPRRRLSVQRSGTDLISPEHGWVASAGRSRFLAVVTRKALLMLFFLVGVLPMGIVFGADAVAHCSARRPGGYER